MRAVAAILVFWHHGSGVYGGVSSGMVGVSLFYMLSGFVMAWTDRSDDASSTFCRRRFARIYPAYAVAVALAVVYSAITIGVSWKDFFALTLLQSWIPDEKVYFAASAVFWSLSCEVFFYVMFPLIRRFTRATSMRGLSLLAALAGTISVTVAIVGTRFPETEHLTWATVVFPPARLPEFVVGVCLGSLMARGWHPRVSVVFALVLAAGGVAAAMLVPYSLSRYAVTLIPFAVLIVALAAADIRGRSTFAQSKLMVRLGVWSYCFYLLHLVVLMVVVGLGARFGLPLWLSIVVALFASIVAAWALHVLVERPSERILRPTGRSRADTD